MESKEKMIAGKIMKLETGKIARQSNGSVIVTYGETTVLATVNAAKEPREDVDFFPLQVEYKTLLNHKRFHFLFWVQKDVAKTKIRILRTKGDKIVIVVHDTRNFRSITSN